MPICIHMSTHITQENMAVSDKLVAELVIVFVEEKNDKKDIIKNWFKPHELWFYSIVSVSQSGSNSYRELSENVAASTAARV